MSRLGCIAVVLLVPLVGRAFDVQATIKRVEAENSRLTFGAPDGRERTAKVAPDARLLDADGKDLTGGLKSEQLKEGAKAVLTVLVDDYAEVWVNGQIPRRAGYPSPATIQGFNMPNRVVLTEAVKPGEKFQIAVFGINGPISVAPANTVWFREARVEFYR